VHTWFIDRNIYKTYKMSYIGIYKTPFIYKVCKEMQCHLHIFKQPAVHGPYLKCLYSFKAKILMLLSLQRGLIHRMK